MTIQKIGQTKAVDPSRAEMTLCFDDVSFAYPSRPQPVLRNIAFDISPGKSLALVGRSGCGKSTTLKLLIRFLDADSGRILLDDVPLDHYDKKQWRQMLGVASQEPCPCNRSIRENICRCRPFTQEQIEDACKIAYAHDFIMTLEKGYDSLLGPSGVSLSERQKQRIAIARAVVCNPRLLILDEATSALDSRSERIVQEALDRASAGRSTIVVAHRLSTIRAVDRVIVMEEGEIVESGGFDELRTKEGGIFAQMLLD